MMLGRHQQGHENALPAVVPKNGSGITLTSNVELLNFELFSGQEVRFNGRSQTGLF